MSKLTNPQAILFELHKKKKDVIFWVFSIAFALLIFLFISSKDYSFLLVLSSLVQMLGFIIIIIKVTHFHSCSGLSLNSCICYCILLSARLTSTLFYTGYLPMDAAGDWFYQFTEIISLICCIGLILCLKVFYKETADKQIDLVEYYYLAIPNLVLAMLIHTSLNGLWLTDVLWSFAMYLEGVAVFPQIVLFVNKKAQIEPYTSHYVALCGLSRLLSLLFWWDTFPELNVYNAYSYSLFSHYTGYFIIVSQIIQLVIMGDYYYYYLKSLIKGEQMIICDI